MIKKSSEKMFSSEQKSKYSSNDQKKIQIFQKPVKDWNFNDVAHWLQKIGFVEYKDVFYENRVNGTVLMTLSKEELKSIGVQSLQDRYPIWKQICKLQKDGSKFF
jgi:hypothetical protein